MLWSNLNLYYNCGDGDKISPTRSELHGFIEAWQFLGIALQLTKQEHCPKLCTFCINVFPVFVLNLRVHCYYFNCHVGVDSSCFQIIVVLSISAQGGKPNIDLHWSTYKPSIGSSPKFTHNSRQSTSSLPPVDTTLSPPSPSPSPDPSSSIPSSPFPCSSPSPSEVWRHHTPPPTPPILKSASKGGRFPTTPPPQRRNKLHLEAFQPLTKSKSHESQLSVKINQDLDLSKYVADLPD